MEAMATFFGKKQGAQISVLIPRQRFRLKLAGRPARRIARQHQSNSACSGGYANPGGDHSFCLCGRNLAKTRMRFVFTHSHAFPRGTVVVEDGTESGSDAQVEFADGVTLIAEWWRDGENIILDIPSYQTAKGTMVGPRRWRLTRRSDGTWRSGWDT